RDRFDLFDPRHPFYQTADPGDAEPVSVAYLAMQLPKADRAAWFVHAHEDQHALCPACCARQLATLPPLAFAGGSTPPQRGKGARVGYKAGLNGANALYVLLHGETLFQTLLWNYALPPARPPQADDAADRPAWAGDGTVGRGAEVARVGYVRSLTWQPRRV